MKSTRSTLLPLAALALIAGASLLSARPAAAGGVRAGSAADSPRPPTPRSKARNPTASALLAARARMFAQMERARRLIEAYRRLVESQENRLRHARTSSEFELLLRAHRADREQFARDVRQAREALGQASREYFQLKRAAEGRGDPGRFHVPSPQRGGGRRG